MKRVIFILFLFPIIYSCSKTESIPTVTPPVVIKLSACDSIKRGLLNTTSDTVRLVSCVSIIGCDSLRLGILKPNTQDTLRLLSCIKISACDSVRLGILKPNTQDTLRLLSCINIKLTGCDSVRLGLLKSTKDLLRLGCNSVTIGTQKWMIVNLDIETYRNGDIIPQVTDIKTWGELRTGAWCYFNFDPANGVIYGKLYNWYAVNDPRGLAPQGWHIPTDDEWTTLGNFLGGNEVAGGKMKTTGITLWNTPNLGATNQSGFAGLPGGTLSFESGSSAKTLGEVGFWWSATGASPDYDITKAWTRAVNYNTAKLFRNYNSKINGISVRCLKD